MDDRTAARESMAVLRDFLNNIDAELQALAGDFQAGRINPLLARVRESNLRQRREVVQGQFDRLLSATKDF